MAFSPLQQALEKVQAAGRARFHMPGHKGACPPLSCLGRALPFDVTELPDTGSLFDGLGATAQAEELAARFFGAGTTLFSAGGCTLAIQTMLKCACGFGGEVIMDRCIHRSALNTLVLLRSSPVWVWRRPEGDGLAGRLHPEDVEAALRSHPEARAVYVTSPDYYGVISDIASLAQVARRYGVPLLVDNAHGAHLGLLRESLHPMDLGADFAACSAHKTLPVLTGGAWLNLRETVPPNKVRETMALFGSTSPSFLILLSLDLARCWMEEQGKAEFSHLEDRVSEIKEMAAGLGYGLPKGVCDPVRLTLDTAKRGLSGREAASFLRRHGVEPEYADERFLVCIPTPFQSPEDWERLEAALRGMPQKDGLPPSPWRAEPPEICFTPAQAAAFPVEGIPLEESEGRIAASVHMPCPPAIPVVMPGEKVNKKIIELLRNYEISTIEVVKI